MSTGEIEMVDAVAMAILGLKAAGHAVVKKVVSTVCDIPKRVFFVSIGIQVKLIYLAFNCLIRMYRVVRNTAIFKYIFPAYPSSPVVNNDAVVKGAKKMRRALLMSYEDASELGIMSGTPEITAVLQEIFDAIDRDIEDNQSIFDGIEKIKELTRPYEDGTWLKKVMKDLEVIEFTDDESEAEEDKPINMLDKPECDKPPVDSNISNEQEVSLSEEIKYEKPEVKKSKPVINTRQQNGILRRRLAVTNAKLEQVLKMSSDLVGELTTLNDNVSHLAVVSERMAIMQHELGEGRRLLCEIVEERNEMKRKLSTLEHMIQEEERFLDDVSCESGYDEGEILNH